MARTIAKDHAKKRGLILQAAAEVFAREGFDRTSMNTVARACAMSKAAIYHYYGGKDELLFDILDEYLSDLRDNAVTLDISGLTAPEQLRAVVRQIVECYRGMDAQHQLQTTAMAQLPADKQAVLRGYQRDMVKQMSGILSRAAPEVFESDPEKLRAVTMSVFGMLNWHYMWAKAADSAARRTYADLITDLTLGGIAAV